MKQFSGKKTGKGGPVVFRKYGWLLRTLAVIALSSVCAAGELDTLSRQFADPPDGVKPYVFWYWINGNISREGLAADLDAMKQAGIGGAVIFNIGRHGPAGPVKVLSPEWRELMRFAIRRAGELGIKVSLNNSMSGWSSSGGPWITPEMAMQKVTWSETRIKGGGAFDGTLPVPPVKLDCYRDIAVIAFPTPAAECGDEPHPEVRSGNGTVDLRFPGSEPVSVRSVSIVPPESQSLPDGKLLASDDGEIWREVLAFSKLRKFAPVNRVFPAEKARFWRFEFSSGVPLAEIRLEPAYRIADWTGKALFDPYGLDKPEFTDDPALQAPDGCVIERQRIVDLSGKTDADGRLHWDVPAGDWTVLRFGYTPTGSKPEPSPEGCGLECDKLSPAALDVHWQNSVQPWLDDPGLNRLIQYVHVDSYERFAQNWTARMTEEFRKRCGYELTEYLPALTGRVVGDVRESERFLWDFRKTVTGLMHENYFGHMRELCAKAGKQFTCEPYHQNQFDNVTAGGQADVPMCEVWAGPQPAAPYWMKLGASPAHVYGRQIVQCETMTANGPNGGNWSNDFRDMKTGCDAVFCGGINRMVFHVYVHQPWTNLVPGQTLAVFGTHFERSNTWWKQMPGFTRYVSRCQHLLQQGRFVADILYSCGENSPNAGLELSGPDAPPAGYDYDVCDPYVIMNRLTVKDGRLTLPEGGSYRLLVLPDDTAMTPEMVRCIGGLTAAGASVAAPRPVHSPGLSGQPAADEQVRAMADTIWGAHDGKGRIFPVQPLSQVLAGLDIQPDFKTGTDVPVRYIHKQIDGTDCYFVASSSDKPFRTDAAFRTTNGIPQLWDPCTGEIRDLPVFQKEGRCTVVPLRFEPRQSFFVVFNGGGKPGRSGGCNFPEYRPVAELEGPWNVTFALPSGSTNAVFAALEDWSKRPEPGIRYYSGTATYRKQFDFSGPAAGNPVYLDLGRVKNVAEVRLNGKPLGIVWCAPWRVEITGAVQAGDNVLEVDVINLWVNRLIGDEQLPADCEYTAGVWRLLKEWPEWLVKNGPRTSGRRTFSTFKHWDKNSPLMESGLLGPVTVQTGE